MFDIFLWTGAKSLPDLSEFALDNDLKSIISANSKRALEGHPRFLGLDLPLEIATDLLRRLESQKGRGLVVEAKYREPKISKEAAFLIAERHLLEIHQTIPNVTFDPVVFRRDDIMVWQFCSVSPEWIEQGRIPGALIASVDKIDGRIWDADDFGRYLNLISDGKD